MFLLAELFTILHGFASLGIPERSYLMFSGSFDLMISFYIGEYSVMQNNQLVFYSGVSTVFVYLSLACH